MSDAQCIVAADVGNSALTLCVRCSGNCDQAQRSLSDHSIAIDGDSWQTKAIAWVRDQVGCQAPHWRIASVHRHAASELQRAIACRQPQARVDQTSRHDVPLTTRVEQPDRLGIDRLLSAYAASNRFAVPLIVVDAGSAVTVDLVSSDAEFLGGAILPGLSLQTRALASGTDALPHLSWHADVAIQTPGRNTTEAIRLGVLLGLAGAIERLVDSYGDVPGCASENCQVVVTGGDAGNLSPHLRFPHQIVPHLVCLGLLDLPRSTNQQKT